MPKVVGESIDKTSGAMALLILPIALKVQPCTNGRPVLCRHVIQLIDILKVAHSLGIAHNDVKPDNIYINIENEDNALLNDWASSCSFGTFLYKRGTYGFYDQTSGEVAFNPKPQDDLKALVKSAYLMLFNAPPPHPIFIQNLEQFWSCMYGVPLWKKALEHADESNYEALGELFQFK